MALYTILYVVLGLSAGTLVNLCIVRLSKGEPVFRKPSRCDSCGSGSRIAELVPLLGYLNLKGRCPDCSMKIPVRQPLVEVAGAVIFVLMLYKYGPGAESLLIAYLMCILLAVFFIDIDKRIIPDKLVLAGLAGGLLQMALNLFKPLVIMGDRTWWNPLAGAVLGSGILFLISVTGYIIYKSDDAMGMGDVKLLAPIGMLIGWRMVIIVLILSVLLSGMTALAMILTGKRNRKSTMPFGPFIVTSAFIAIMSGWNIWNWYFGKIQ